MNRTLRIHAATEGGLAEALRRELRAVGNLDYDGSPYSVAYDVDVEEVAPFKPIDEASLSEVLYRSVPSDVQTHDDGWIRNSGEGCPPVQAMDIVDVRFQVPRDHMSKCRTACFVAWSLVNLYRPIHDPEGTPYCSADGLEPWAEYVATDEDGTVCQYPDKPQTSITFPDHWVGGSTRLYDVAPDKFSNTHEHWTNTLRRVWRPHE